VAADELITLALSIVAARQGATKPEAAQLTETQKRDVAYVWTSLYKSCLTLIGAEDDPPPVYHDEIASKCSTAAEVGMLTSNPGEVYFSVFAAAWLAERIGDIPRSWALRRQVEGHVSGMVWPPIFKQDGKYKFALPGPNIKKQ
jgi:hypothetical protein